MQKNENIGLRVFRAGVDDVQHHRKRFSSFLIERKSEWNDFTKPKGTPMVERTVQKLGRRLDRWRRSRSPLKIAFLLFLMLISIVSSAAAAGGDLKNTGTINNTGTIKVRNQAIGLPMVNSGVFEFFGADQPIPGRQFADLRLMGSGTKTVTGGTVSVFGTMTVANGVTVDASSTNIVRLNGSLDEQGYVLGTIEKTLTLTGSSGSSSFGNIGATISWSGTAPGTTTISRVTGVVSTSTEPGFTSSQSIKRYYDIAPTFGIGLNGTLVFGYRESELNGQEESTLSLWRSLDGGLTWRKQGGTVDAKANTITKSGILSFSRWTASDAANPLGPNFIEGVAQNMVSASGNNQTGPINTPLVQPFIVTVRDYYGNPIAGVNVEFAISSFPSGASGQSLSATSVLTGASGQAAATLTLGNLPGTYTVTASSGSLAGSPLTFSAIAVGAPPPPPPPGPVAAAMVLASGQNQVGTVGKTLDSAFVVRVLDQNGQPFVGATVRFSLSAAPTGATGQRLSADSMVTNSAGLAFTQLTLGSRVGLYTVQVTSGTLTPISFNATAVAGAPKFLTQVSGNNQVGQIRATLPQPFVVSITDTFGNAKQGIEVRFAISGVPTGAAGQRLSDSLVTTNASGLAQTTLTLGDSAGTYMVTTTSPSLPGSSFTFVANAVRTAPRQIALLSGNNQRGPVTTTLANPLVVVVTDSAGVPVSGVTVSFAITQVPQGATGQALSVDRVNTDGQGRASTSLTLGNRPGTYMVQASAAGLLDSPITFTATADIGPAAVLVFVSGDGQTGEVLKVLAQPLRVQVTDVAGNGVQNVPVTFAVDSIPNGATGAFVNGATSTEVRTDGNGIASVSMTLGNRAGVYRVAASSTGLANSPIYFRLTAAHGPAVAMTYVRGDGQRQRINTVLDSLFVVRVTDVGGNPVPGVAVAFTLDSIPSGSVGHALTVVNGVTNAQGEASARLTLGSRAGRYVVHAAVSGVTGSPIRFVATATHDVAASLIFASGSGQQELITRELMAPFVVHVVDVGGNPVPGVAVQFSIVEKPQGATGDRIRVVNSTSDVEGKVAAYLTLGNQVGRYVVSATAPGLSGSPVLFTADGTRLISEIQQTVRELNIADLTTLIDHLLEKISPLTGLDSVRVDMNKDGRLSIADVELIRTTLLTIRSTSSEATDALASQVVKNMAIGARAGIDTTSDVKGEFVLSETGLRFNMTNKVPVKGLHLIVRLKNPVSITAPDVIFDRARHHQFFINTSGLEMRIVAYNNENIAIAPDSGVLFRLPIKLSDVAEITDGQVIVSKADNIVEADQVLKGPVEKRRVEEGDKIPYTFVLYQNYPNPFNAQTKIEYEVPELEGRMASVLIQVYNVSGEKVKTLFVGQRPSGRYFVTWDGSDDYGNKMPSGTYFYRLISGDFQTAKRMIMLK